MYTSAAQILSDILPSTLITVPGAHPRDGQPLQPRPRSATSSASGATAQQALHRGSFGLPHSAPSLHLHLAGSMHASTPPIGWLKSAPGARHAAAAEQRPRPMGRSHSYPAHLRAQLGPEAVSIQAMPPLPAAPMLRTSSHSHALGGGGHQQLASTSQQEGWGNPEGSQGEPVLAPGLEGRGADHEGGAQPPVDVPDQGTPQEEQLGRARDEVLLISGGSAHLGTGTGLIASVAQEHSSWAAANPEPTEQQFIEVRLCRSSRMYHCMLVVVLLWTCLSGITTDYCVRFQAEFRIRRRISHKSSYVHALTPDFLSDVLQHISICVYLWVFRRVPLWLPQRGSHNADNARARGDKRCFCAKAGLAYLLLSQ